MDIFRLNEDVKELLNSISEEYGAYRYYDEVKEIADKLEDCNAYGYEPYRFGSWEVQAYYDGSEDLFTVSAGLTDNMTDFLLREISYPVRDGHMEYYGLDVIINNGCNLTKEDLLSLDPDHNLFDEKDIDDMFNGEELEFWIDYEIVFKEDIETDDDEYNDEYDEEDE